MNEPKLDELGQTDRFCLFNDWLAGEVAGERAQEIASDLARPDSLIFGAISELDEAARPLTSDLPAAQPASGVAAIRFWPLAAAAALIAAVTLGFLAYRRPADPARQVAALEQRAKALQEAAPAPAEIRKLRDDLSGSPIEVAALAWHSETLLQFMTKTRPRSPSAIEAEFGSQVDRVLAAAHAESRPGSPTVILAGLPAGQRDYARQLYGSVWQYAGDSGRKLDPKLEGFLIDARRPGENVGMIVPSYFMTMDAAERASWDRIVALGGKTLPVKIVNTRQYTEGFVPTQAYDQAIEHARTNGVEVFAYVNCDGGLKDEKAVETELRKWHELFPGRFDGIYFDNQSMYDDSRLLYFTRIFKLARQLEPKWKVISATDGACDEAFIKILKDNIICYKTNGTFPRFNGWEKKYGRERFGALIHQVDRLSEADFLQAAAVFGWVYATAKAEAIHTYKTLPPFLEEESALLKRLNGEEPAPRKNRQASNAWPQGVGFPPPPGQACRSIATALRKNFTRSGSAI